MPENVMAKAREPVQLEPFVHQVSGHSSMLRFDEHSLCKPLNPREHHFYETMPSDMRQFVPKYYSVIEVAVHEDSDGFMTLVAFPPESKKKKRVLPPSSSPSSSGEGAQSDSDSKSPEAPRARQRFRMRRTGSIEAVDSLNQKFEVVDSDSNDADTSTAGHNPWSLRCHKEQLAKMKKNSKDKSSHKFILLENLVSHFKAPCILDLKMGPRQHGDDATEEKRQIQVSKCANTTSSTLGFRICGMQVYQANTGRFICHDKYYGRRLKSEGLPDALYQFLHNGYRLQANIIDFILDRLRRLYTLLSKQNTFRFYSSSLLIIYEGLEDLNSSVHDPTSETDNMAGRTASALSQNNGPGSVSECSDNAMSCASSEPGTSDHTVDGMKNAHASSWDGGKLEPRVDVRMIDFAHTTHQGFKGDRLVHSGPDKGYLFGLENLIRIFEDVKLRSS